MTFQVEVRVLPRRGILDPQGKAVGGALSSLGFRGVSEVHIGRVIVLLLEAPSAEAAHENAEAMCRQLLANPVTEDYEIQVHEPLGSQA
ncbi:MAG: phosphoribosylformylglycinamidine synthase subunit PurS [Gemmatimonadota bacterium]|jgi:phosphoribosylformylglycinamidine synthase|nr:phosphoribosylformylglycinamidine synthase subunit PurS [Gemmatimonadota bacterium]